jgi:hypothetical protein
MTHGAHIAIIAAEQERKRKQQREEEEMTTYSSDDLNENWEFNFVRSATRAFRNPDLFAALLEEESLAGWELVEKLDDQRIRFKRPRDVRSKDHRLPPGLDPYRTQYGSTTNAPLVATIFGLVIALAGGVAVIFFMGAPSVSILGLAAILIPGILVLVGIIAVVAVARNR